MPMNEHNEIEIISSTQSPNDLQVKIIRTSYIIIISKYVFLDLKMRLISNKNCSIIFNILFSNFQISNLSCCLF